MHFQAGTGGEVMEKKTVELPLFSVEDEGRSFDVLYFTCAVAATSIMSMSPKHGPTESSAEHVTHPTPHTKKSLANVDTTHRRHQLLFVTLPEIVGRHPHNLYTAPEKMYCLSEGTDTGEQFLAQWCLPCASIQAA